MSTMTSSRRAPGDIQELSEELLGVELEAALELSAHEGREIPEICEMERKERDFKYVAEIRGSYDGRRGLNTIYDTKVNQVKRRNDFLRRQKESRDEIIDKIRELEELSTDTEEEEDDVNFATKKPVELMDTTAPKPKKKSKPSPTELMHSDWMTEKPDDLEENWYGVICPKGRRVLVVSYKGRTRIYTRRNDFLGSFKSLLPGGYKLKENAASHFRGVTMLDCIWSEISQKFYVLDMICWNSSSCANCDTEYRQFFLTSKISENPQLLERSTENPFPFVPLKYFRADTLPLFVTSIIPPFPEDIDGILFFHKETFYVVPGKNPLNLWVRLSDAEKILGVTPSPEILERENKKGKKLPPKNGERPPPRNPRVVPMEPPRQPRVVTFEPLEADQNWRSGLPIRRSPPRPSGEVDGDWVEEDWRYRN